MWIRLPKQNASKSAPISRFKSWIWKLKLVVFAGCVVWVASQFSGRIMSQEPRPFQSNYSLSSPASQFSQESTPASLQNAPLSPAGTQTIPSGTQSAEPFNAALPAGTQPVGTQSPPPAQPIPAIPAPRDIGMRILHRTLLESVWGPPTMCEVRQSIQIVDKKRSTFGKYVRSGKGLGRMRMTLQVPAADQMNSLLQVSDGELLTTFESIGTHSMMTQIDLGKVRERLTITNETLQDPVVAMYLAIGGQAEVLKDLPKVRLDQGHRRPTR
ncbi:MAG: hypothetical protein U0930_01715 [Pirellulales bacterium]